MNTIDFYYDVVCPYAYLASTQIEAVAARTGAQVRWRPILLGGLFRHVNGDQNPGAVMSAPRARLNLLDMHRWADRWGVALQMPNDHPRRTVDAMRLLVGAPEAKRPALSKALFQAYWVDGRDVRDRTVLGDIAAAHGVDLAVIDDPQVKQGLFDTTAEAAEHGAFGVPATVVDGQLWWGQDRLHLVEAALGGPGRQPFPKGRGGRITLFHDFSSPFSYLGSTQVERLARETGAELVYRPFLLGGLFREIGTPDVPLLAMNAAKQRYLQKDLHDWARWWGVDFSFPRNFPIRTVTPLRAALAAPQATTAIYRAAWAEDRKIDDDAVLVEVLNEAGCDGPAVLAQTRDPAIKAALRANGAAAAAAGVCGVPSFLVEVAGETELFWGQDRMRLVAEYLEG